MYRFWETIIERACEILQPGTIVEIGVDAGKHTELLLAYCRRAGAQLEAIDPEPAIDPLVMFASFQRHLRFHRDLSLNVLWNLPQMDMVLIDGDHNWYTVFHELLMIERFAQRSGHFPVVFLHDVGWPYARRDVYYVPERIPEGFRKSLAQKGMQRGSGMLLEHGGLNPQMQNAVEENDHQNGVLTAVEDFLEQSTLQLRFVQVPGHHGLGIIAPVSLLDANPRFSAFLNALAISPLIHEHIEQMEGDLIDTVVALKARTKLWEQTLALKEADIERLHAEERWHQEDLQRQAAEQILLHRKIAALETTIAEKEDTLTHREETIQSLRMDLHHFQRTRSWRYTAWLRKMESWLRSVHLKHLPYQIFADIRTVWIATGRPFPRLTHAVRYDILGPIWPVRPAPLPQSLNASSSAVQSAVSISHGARKRRPRVLLFIDQPQWAFSTIAQAIVQHLGNAFDFEILALAEQPVIDEAAYDIVHVFFESESYHKRFLKGKAKVVKSVYSHYWQLDGLTPQSFYTQHLQEADVITVPSRKLLHLLTDLPVPVSLVPEGVDTTVFKALSKRTGPLIVGWAGNPTRPVKRLQWLQEACEGWCTLRIADGTLSAQEMVDFYNSVDVIACSSVAEGCPRPLLEGMACGAFPVMFDVGIAREMIEHERNGLIVEEESVAGLRRALEWCRDHIDVVRSSADMNAAHIRGSRNWASVLQPLGAVYRSVLSDATLE